MPNILPVIRIKKNIERVTAGKVEDKRLEKFKLELENLSEEELKNVISGLFISISHGTTKKGLLNYIKEL